MEVGGFRHCSLCRRSTSLQTESAWSAYFAAPEQWTLQRTTGQPTLRAAHRLHVVRPSRPSPRVTQIEESTFFARDRAPLKSGDLRLGLAILAETPESRPSRETDEVFPLATKALESDSINAFSRGAESREEEANKGDGEVSTGPHSVMKFAVSELRFSACLIDYKEPYQLRQQWIRTAAMRAANPSASRTARIPEEEKC